MNFQQTTLSNGLTLIAETNPSVHSVAAGLFVRAGSRDETADVSGVSPPEAASTTASAEIHSLDANDTTAVVFQAPGSNVTVIWLSSADDTDDDDGDDTLDQDLPSDVPSEVEAEISHDDATAMP